MITYEYFCLSCAKNFEIKHSIKDDDWTTCPECAEESLVKSIVPSYDVDIFDGTPKTVGGLADRNTAKLGSVQREQREQERAEKKKLAKEYWANKGIKSYE